MATEREKVVYAIVAELGRQGVYNRPLGGALQVDGLINAYELADAVLRAGHAETSTTTGAAPLSGPYLALAVQTANVQASFVGGRPPQPTPPR